MEGLDYKLSKEVIRDTIALFDEREKYIEVVLGELFSKYKNNKGFYEILIKVTTLNSLYSAGLNNTDGKKTIDVVTMAEHILLEPRLDNWLASEDKNTLLKAYEYIAYGISDVRDTNYNKCYAFASKYCSWHRPDKYPIMDSCAKRNLYLFLMNNDIPNKEELIGYEKLKGGEFFEYELFWDLCVKFQAYVNMKYSDENNYIMKDIDKFLWMYGRDDSSSESISSKGQIEKG